MPVLPIRQPASAADRFRTLTLRVDLKNRTAQLDGFQSLYFADTVNVIVDGISGVSAADLQLWLWKKDVPTSQDQALAYHYDFTAATGNPSKATATITLNSVNLKAALAAVAVGGSLTARLQIRESNMIVVDQDVEVRPNHYTDVVPDIDPESPVTNPYVRRDDLRPWALNLLATADLSNPDAMAEVIVQILTKLSDVTAS